MNKVKTILSKIKLPKVKLPKLSLPKFKLPKIKLPNVKLPNFKMPKLPKISMPKLNMDKIKPLLIKVFPVIKKFLNLLIKAAKGFISWIGKAVKESIAQVWTLLGFFIAWLTLTGTAQQIVGIATIFATILWLITIPLREEKE